MKISDYTDFQKKEIVIAYLMILPMLIGFALFTVYPILWVIKWAWYAYDGMVNPEFIGFENFIRLFTRDSQYWQSLLNTGIITFSKIIILIPLSLILAISLNANTKKSALFRLIIFMPNVISVAIIGLIFGIMFASYKGIINEYLLALNIIEKPVEWLSSKQSAMFTIVAAAVWQNIGLTMVFFLMGLQSIPKELYECAEIDGANTLRKHLSVTIPLLGPVLQVVILLEIIWSMKTTDLVLVLTNGGPAGQTEVVMTYVFKYFFSYNSSGGTASQFGYAASLGVVTAIILGIITLIYVRFTRKMNEVR